MLAGHMNETMVIKHTTHVVSSIVVAMSVMVASDTLHFVSLAALSLRALFPDIDEPNSWIGRRSLGIKRERSESSFGILWRVERTFS